MLDTSTKDRIEEVFLQAKELEGVARTRFLDEQCHDMALVRAEVERLLRADDAADSMLDRPAHMVDSTSAGETEPTEGTVVGPFKLLQQIGEGGFGVVYMAEQTRPVRRKVALKIVKPGMDSKEVVARFEAERQALAMMDHPNIAKVLDAGTTESGRPFFAMELVKGVSITDYCDENKLPTKERLRLFQQVCRAVQHAHQKGIIHRDIKPSNVMVTLHDGEPVPKVIDFGVAKALCQHLTEKTLFTRYGQIVGTPQYMSPEQAEMSGLDVDTRSDIYSLGVLLYELLTGQTPLDAQTLRSAGYDAMRKMIRESEPPKPSTKYRTLDQESATCIASHRATIPTTLSSTIAGDLDWIVMKSLDTNRNRRYESANGLLSDIDRYLSNEPVEAGPPTFGYLFTKLYQRNKIAVLTTAAVACLLLLATGLTTRAWLDAVAQREIALAAVDDLNEKQAEVQTQKNEADTQAIKAKQEANRSRATLDVLKSLLAQATPDPKLGTEVKVSDFLETFAQQLQAQPLADPEVEIEVRKTLATSLKSFSLDEKAHEQLLSAEQLGRKAYPPKSLELANLLHQLGFESRREAERLQMEALSIIEEEDRDSVLTVCVLTELGWITLQRPEVSEKFFRRAIAIRKSLKPAEWHNLKDLPERGLARNLNEQTRLEDAAIAAQAAIKLANELNNQGELAKSLLALSDIHINSRDFKAATRTNEKALEVAAADNDTETLLGGWWQRLWRIESQRPTFNVEAVTDAAKRSQQFLESSWSRIRNRRLGEFMGQIHGALLFSDLDENAAGIRRLSKLLSKQEQRNFAGATAQWLRIEGDIGHSIQWYKQANPNDVWLPIKWGRSYEAIRDFPKQLLKLEAALPLIQGETEGWTSLGLDLAIASTLERTLRDQAAQEKYTKLLPKLTKASDRLWGGPTAGAKLLVMEKCRDPKNPFDESPNSTHFVLMQQLEGDLGSRPTGRVYSHAALGMIAERRGNLSRAIDHFVKANHERPGTFAQLHNEWVTDRMVNLLVRASRFDECERILRADITRRDKQVSPIHPERAFVRLRLVQFLVDHDRDTAGAKEWLAEAKKIYDYHANVLPKVEREKLSKLEDAISQSER